MNYSSSQCATLLLYITREIEGLSFPTCILPPRQSYRCGLHRRQLEAHDSRQAFVLESSLQYVAVSSLDSATFQVTSQIQILPIAVLSILLLKTSLLARKWLALGLLMVSLAIIQSTHHDIENSTSLKEIQSNSLFSSLTGSIAKLWRFSSQSSTQAVCNIGRNTGRWYAGASQMNAILGLATVVLDCPVSAAASVYFERVLKD